MSAEYKQEIERLTPFANELSALAEKHGVPPMVVVWLGKRHIVGIEPDTAAPRAHDHVVCAITALHEYLGWLFAREHGLPTFAVGAAARAPADYQELLPSYILETLAFRCTKTGEHEEHELTVLGHIFRWRYGGKSVPIVEVTYPYSGERGPC